MIGCVAFVHRNWVMAFSLGLAVLAAAFGSLLLGTRFVPHLEMVAYFWWGVMYGFVRELPASEQKAWALLIGLAIVAFLLLGTRGLERTGVLHFGCGIGHCSSASALGSEGHGALR